MGSVAIQKLAAGGFEPGLLVTKLGGDRLTGTLGLGDAVFPSILASFLKRFDDDANAKADANTNNDTNNTDRNGNDDNNHKSGTFEASLWGYIAGCLACEFAPTIATQGVPALVFLVPSMGIATVGSAVVSGRIEELISYNNNNNNEAENTSSGN